ncbi:lactonase family protein [Snuella sedimenti]|uniref:Lactonase family protein n=1 Tax=Snuella sedimenti TaxID=2798802 RepID=A0A8J7LU31_9FLAO|nr:lactonase family protein [Snuella sedimenti]MBJ6369141.1 lactonase family protein [Snuella sedimenti]
MKIKLVFICLATLCLTNCSIPHSSLYVGTYTSGESEGIYKFQFNTETGELSELQLVAKTENPSFLSYSPDRNYIYAVNENENGSVSAFKIDTNGMLSHLNTVDSNGAHPCHIAINTTGNRAVVSNYTGGTVSLYAIHSNGHLDKAYKVFNHNAPDSISHAHSAHFYKDKLYVSDLGRNGLYNYQLSENQEDYNLITPSIVNMTENAGPRHFTMTKDGQFIYIINEYANTVTSAKKSNGAFELLEHVSTLKDDFKGESYCADIHLSKDEHFLYGSNRGENTIVVFKRDKQSGKLEKIQNMDVQGNWPRNFSLDPSGNFLLVANQKSNNISVFKVDSDSGKLSFLHSVDLPSPVCLLF